MRKRNWILVQLLAALLIFPGCVTELHNIRAAGFINEKFDQSIVFGRLKVNKELSQASYVLNMKNLATSQEYRYAMKNWDCADTDCSSQPFCLALPTGPYHIFRMDIRQKNAVSHVDLNIKFKVVPLSTIYLGTLAIGDSPRSVRLFDDRQAEEQELADFCPGVKHGVYEVSLMESTEGNPDKEYQGRTYMEEDFQLIPVK